MQENKRSIAATATVLVVVLAAAGGHLARKNVEIGPEAATPSSLLRPGILASNADSAPLTESEYFYQLSLLLDRQFVDPIDDPAKLASGAVRGMVGSLLDPNSFHMSREQFAAYQDQLAGKYQGIGVELRFTFDSAELKKAQDRDKDVDGLLLIPDLHVTSVVPGGPAEAAGIKPGDRITKVDGKWLVSSRDVKKIREMQTAVTDGKITAAELEAFRQEFVKKADNSIPVNKAREELATGESGSVAVEWERDGKTSTETISRTTSQVPAVSPTGDGKIALRVLKGAADALNEAIGTQKSLTLDLRNSGQGDFSEVRKILEVLVPAGNYGTLATERTGEPRTLTTSAGPASAPAINLIVDTTTRGAAEILALALNGRGLARLTGSQMSGERVWIESFPMPDGSGYSLTTAIYRPNLQKGASR